MTIRKLAKDAPAVASAAMQAQATPEQIAQLNAAVQFQKIHNNLLDMPQNEAYAKFQSYKPETQKVLSELYHPKYTQEDKGILLNTLRGSYNLVKSAIWYGGGSTKGVLGSILDLNASDVILNVGKKAGAYALTPLADEKNPVGGVLSDLLRPATKLIKQPYQASVLSAESLTDEQIMNWEAWKNVGNFWAQGVRELLPGGQDISPNYVGDDWRKYWAAAADAESVYSPEALAEFEPTLDPSIAYLAKTLASGKDLVGEFDTYKNNPNVTGLVALWVSGDDATEKKVAEAYARYKKAKISVGRDVARDIVSIFPHKAEKAILGDGPAKAFFNSISGPIDFGVTFGLDPLIIAGKANKAVLASKYSLTKFGATSERFAYAVETRPQVQKYFDEAGKLLNTYKTGTPEASALAYTTLRSRYRELSPDLLDDMTKFGVKDANSAVKFFEGQDVISALSRGDAGIRRVPLLPRYTKFDYASNKLKDFTNFAIQTKNFRSLDIPGGTDDLATVFAQDPIKFAQRLGVEETFAIGPDGRDIKVFTLRDKSVAARVDKFVRNFEIAPKNERLISISDATSADKIFALSRSFLDKTSASMIRRYWIGATEGERVTMLQGILRTYGRALGLENSKVGRDLLASIDSFSDELYSVNQSAINLGELNIKAGILSADDLASAVPQGVRADVADAIQTTTASGKAGRVNASINAEKARIAEERKALSTVKKTLKAQQKLGVDVTDALAKVELQQRILGARWVKLEEARKGVKAQIVEDTVPGEITIFNAAEVNGTQRAIRVYQLENARYLPDFGAWKRAADRAGVLNRVVGDVSNNAAVQAATDLWSFGNLYPRLGIRTSVEEVGTNLLINGAEGFSNYLKGREFSRAQRVVTPGGVKTRILKEKGELKEVETTNLGVIYNSIYKMMGKTMSKAEIAALADDPVKLGQAAATAILNNRIRPSVFNTAYGNRVSEYAGDFAEFNGAPIIEDILGSSYRAEMNLTNPMLRSRELEKFGPSVALNPNIAEALKGQKFADVFTEIRSDNSNFLVNWLFEINNTLGKRNGQFGNIVLWNAHRPQGEVIDKLVTYITTDGKQLAEKFAIYTEKGPQAFAERIYADATYAIRDSAGRVNMGLVNKLRDLGDVSKFTLDDLAKFDQVKYARPTSILGRELIPVSSNNAVGYITRIKDNGFQWVGKQIALLDREPITYGNYIAYREQLKAYQSGVKSSMLASGADEALANSTARLAAHDTALELARSRTLAFVDNADVRTNLAANLKTFGRYYRATEDFYRRISRIARYEPQTIVRLAIINQTFEHSGFIHKDDKGQMYFTYPGGELLADALTTALSKVGITVKIPTPVAYGGYVKMLTPSLDPQSSAPRIGGPVASLAIGALETLPYIGDFIRTHEEKITGGFNKEMPLWRKVLPSQLLRAFDLAFGGDANADNRTSATIKSMRLVVSTGNGPETPADVDNFLRYSVIQAVNIQAIRFFMGFFAPASIQQFENVTVPEELKAAGAFTWNSEFIKFVKRHEGDPNGMDKALTEFATIYPDKLAFTSSATTAGTVANFQKTLDAADFVKKNTQLFNDHKQGAAFFIPISGLSDYGSYQYLKSNGYIKNKDLKKFAYEISTAAARKEYYEIKDKWEAAIAAEQNPAKRSYLREELRTKQQILKAANPLLTNALKGGDKISKDDALTDLRNVLLLGKAPNKELGKKFFSMINTYDIFLRKYDAAGNSTADKAYKKFLKGDAKDILVTMMGDDPNAQSLYWVLLEPLIGE